jgi:uncharacterized damage-inducible protein DinB
MISANDYLWTKRLSNNCNPRSSRSNLVEVKKNKTINWLTNIQQDDQYAAIDYATRQRKEIATQYKQHDKEMSEEQNVTAI